MRRRHADLTIELARSGGVISTRRHRELRHAVSEFVAAGTLIRLYPTVYVLAERRSDPDVRIRAAHLWRPASIITGRAAARLSFWPDLPVGQVELAVSGHQRPWPGARLERRSLPAGSCVLHRGVVLTRPPLTAVDLIPDLGGAVVCRALWVGIGWDEMWHAIDAIPGRDGHDERRRTLRAYRNLPWSEAEQQFHKLLRRARLRGWIANYPVGVDGTRRYVDVAFPEWLVAIEIDGFAFHSDRNRFELDRRIGSSLTARGWRVLRFTWRQLNDEPDWVIGAVRATLRRARRTQAPVEADFCAE